MKEIKQENGFNSLRKFVAAYRAAEWTKNYEAFFHDPNVMRILDNAENKVRTHYGYKFQKKEMPYQKDVSTLHELRDPEN